MVPLAANESRLPENSTLTYTNATMIPIQV